MARKASARSAARKKAAPTVTVRFANEGQHMAKKTRKSPKKRRKARKNPSNPARRRPRRNAAAARSNPRRRRRNPSSGFGDRAMKLAGGALVAVATGVATTFAMTRIKPGSPVSMYGIPAVAFLGGAALAKSHPMLGGGMALGAFTPFVVPLASKALAAATPSTTAAGLGRAFRSMRAVDMGAVDMGAIDYR